MYNEFFIEMFALHEVDSMHCNTVISMYIWVTISKGVSDISGVSNIVKPERMKPSGESRGQPGVPPLDTEAERVSLKSNTNCTFC